jgi:hypothetical protein
MTSLTRHVAITGAALATAGALIGATPTINAGHDITLASAPAVTTTSTAINLMSYSEWQGKSEGHGHGGGSSQAQGAGSYQDDDANDSEDEGDDDHHGWGGGGGGGFGNIGSFITNFLDSNQAQVLSVTAQIPVFNLGPVAVGNSLLANAYYTGFDPGTGVVTGVPGVVAYVTSQIGVPSGNLVQDVVLGLTSMTPRINIGPVAVGNGILAGAYFNGYDSGSGLVTGLPGVVSYVTNSLGLQAAPVAAVKAKATAAVAPASAVVAARSAAAVAAPADAADSATDAAKADDSPRVGRSAAGRGVARAASAVTNARANASRAVK